MIKLAIKSITIKGVNSLKMAEKKIQEVYEDTGIKLMVDREHFDSTGKVHFQNVDASNVSGILLAKIRGAGYDASFV